MCWIEDMGGDERGQRSAPFSFSFDVVFGREWSTFPTSALACLRGYAQHMSVSNGTELMGLTICSSSSSLSYPYLSDVSLFFALILHRLAIPTSLIATRSSSLLTRVLLRQNSPVPYWASMTMSVSIQYYVKIPWCFGAADRFNDRHGAGGRHGVVSPLLNLLLHQFFFPCTSAFAS